MMAVQNGVYELKVQDAQQHLAASRAQLARKEAGVQVYVSKATNQTFRITAARPGVVRLQVVGGCVC